MVDCGRGYRLPAEYLLSRFERNFERNFEEIP
jgi:hypothetical protein